MSVAPPGPVRSMLAEILAGSARYLEKRPRLLAILEKLTEELVRFHAGFSAEKAEARITGVAFVAVDVSAACSEPDRLFVEASWNGHPVAILAERALVLRLVAQALGDVADQSSAAQPNPPTRIELAISRCVLAELAKAIEQAFAEVLSPPLLVIESGDALDRKRFGGGSGSVLEASFELVAGAAKGRVAVILSRSLLDTLPLDKASDQTTSASSETRWAEQLQAGITRTNIELQFILGDWNCSLGELMQLRVGQVLTLDVTPQSLVRAESNDEPILLCELGRLQGRYTARVDDFADRERAFVHGLLAR